VGFVATAVKGKNSLGKNHPTAPKVKKKKKKLLGGTVFFVGKQKPKSSGTRPGGQTQQTQRGVFLGGGKNKQTTVPNTGKKIGAPKTNSKKRGPQRAPPETAFCGVGGGTPVIYNKKKPKHQTTGVTPNPFAPPPPLKKKPLARFWGKTANRKKPPRQTQKKTFFWFVEKRGGQQTTTQKGVGGGKKDPAKTQKPGAFWGAKNTETKKQKKGVHERTPESSKITGGTPKICGVVFRTNKKNQKKKTKPTKKTEGGGKWGGGG